MKSKNKHNDSDAMALFKESFANVALKAMNASRASKSSSKRTENKIRASFKSEIGAVNFLATSLGIGGTESFEKDALKLVDDFVIQTMKNIPEMRKALEEMVATKVEA